MSLARRLILAASLVLLAFVVLTGAALDRAFRANTTELVREQLMTRVYALLAAANLDPTGRFALPADLPDPSLATPASGVFAQVRDEDGHVEWRSRSSLGTEIEYPVPSAPGEPAFAATETATGVPVFALAFAVRWETAPGTEHRYRFEIAQTREPFAAREAGFRRTLWGWLAGAVLLLLCAQGVILRWGLAPLARLATEIDDVEAGRRDAVSEDWPRELRALARSLNALIATGRTLIERQRNALADLAHSLKTPLAVLRAEAGGDAGLVEEQVERMDRSVEYHLRRASTAGGGALARPVAVATLAARVRDAMLKVHADRGIAIELDVDGGCRFLGDEGDVIEILGNLADNACKWARSRVRITAATAGDEGRASFLRIVVEDDGPGIDEAERGRILGRGERGDDSRPGQGIGLALVHELVTTVYGGEIVIDRGDLGGARVGVRLRPPR